jgi:molybdopterin molybdotransferase
MLRAFALEEPMGSAPQQVVEFEEAIAMVLRHARQAAAARVQKHERVKLLDAAGRVLAAGVVADRDQPGFDRSTRDGFAVRAADWVGGAKLRVLGQVRAGDVWRGEAVGSGTAVEIMTGAPVPGGADAVVMVEHTVCDGEWLTPADERVLTRGENVVQRGSEAKLGETVVAAGTRMGAAEIALAASCGCAELEVLTRPVVAIVSTGDELVEVSEVPEAQQIRNSNSYAIAAMVQAAGGFAARLAIARDVHDDIRERVAQGRMWDLMVLSGGVSMGEYDLVEEVLTEFGAEFLFTGVKMQPGKPVVFGRLPKLEDASGAGPECYFFGLPGNPISTQVTFHCFAELMVRALGGEAVNGPRWALATLAEDVAAKAGLTRLLPARMDGTSVRVVGWQGSGDLAANARANCYCELLPFREHAAGEVVRVLLR